MTGRMATKRNGARPLSCSSANRAIGTSTSATAWPAISTRSATLTGNWGRALPLRTANALSSTNGTIDDRDGIADPERAGCAEGVAARDVQQHDIEQGDAHRHEQRAAATPIATNQPNWGRRAWSSRLRRSTQAAHA